MFRLFKKRPEAVKKWILAFILGITSVGMVVTLAPIFPGSDSESLESNVLASVGGAQITSTDLGRSIQSRLRNSPLANDPQIISRMAGTVLDDMILRRALWGQAKKLGIDVSNAEVQESIRTSMPFLYPNGTFVGMDRYRDFISQQAGLSVPQFEAQYRESLLLEKIRAIVTDGVRVSPDEVRDEFVRRDTKVRMDYVLFDPSQFLKAVEVTPKALEEFFEKDPAKYKLPEERRVRYALMDTDYVRAGVKVTDADLTQYYGQHLADYQVSDRVKVSHILFKTEGKTPEEIATLEKTARDVLAQIKAGADFGEMAKKYSEDSSASNGGEIGWIVRGQTVKEFEDAAFSMKPGQVSDLIKTTYGFHIIKVLDRQTAHLQTFDEVKNQIREQLDKQRLADAQQTIASNIERQLQQDPQNFAAVATKNRLEAKETPLFRYNQPVTDFGTSESFHNLAFQLRQGAIGQPISVPKGTAIIQVVEILPEHTPKFEEVRAAVEEDYRAAKSQELAAQRAQEFAAKAKAGDFKKVAQAMGLTVKESKDFTEQDYVEGVGSGTQLAAAFGLAAGQTSEAVQVGANRVVFRVTARTPAPESELAGQQDQIAEELLERKRSLAWEIYQQSLKQQLLASGKLKVNEAAMKKFLATYQKS
ncbi:MAG: peptidyl-prolyl cis-trans isomerase [Acidobacteriia bacterium]|nr:peptidyl-prolyl cis-trans isomerase [Terriglobia bacterium]